MTDTMLGTIHPFSNLLASHEPSIINYDFTDEKMMPSSWSVDTQLFKWQSQGTCFNEF